MKLTMLLFLAALTRASAQAPASAQEEEPPKKHPVSKVVTLLEDMKSELEKEAESDEELYDKMACWCETNDKAKTKAIEDAEARIIDLQSKIEEYAGASARLKVEIEALEKEIAKNVKSLEVATAMREKQAAEFTAEEKDMLQCVKALKDAITVLSKHHPGGASASLLAPQPPTSFELPSSMKEVVNIMKHQISKHGDLIRETLSLEQRKILGAMLQEPALLTVSQPEDYFDAEHTMSQAYAPQSGQIFGILKQLKEDFESNLSESQKEELKNQEAFKELKEAKEAEIATGEEQLAAKKQQLADADEKLAQSKEDLEDTNNSLNADQKFLMELKLKCQSVDVEWEARQKTRKEEIEAVNKAIEILTTDEARELFSKTFNPTFAQKSLKSLQFAQSTRRDQAAKVLIAAGQKFKNPAMVQMAAILRLDSFTRVKKAIDDMVAELLKEKQDEIEHRDMCIKDLNTNELTTESTERDKSDTETTIEDLTGTIKGLKDEIATLTSEIDELKAQLDQAAKDRDAENAEFQATVADQKATQKLVGEALAALKAFYDKKAAAMLLLAKKHQQGQKKQGPPPPPSFEAYEKNRAGGGVMAMLQQIITDAGLLEKEAIKDEENAQKAYQEFQAETNNSIDEKETGITNKNENLAKAEAKKVEMEETLDQLNTELQGLSDEKGDLSKSCDWLLKNFTERQAMRDQEIEALRQVKAILSGMKPEAAR
jgi:chromosome segregation ATPase